MRTLQPTPGKRAMRGPFSRCLSILIYHRVAAKPDPLFPEQVCAREFDRQLRLLASCFEVLPLRAAVARLREGTLPRRAACVTFDDGYADNAEVALPLLRAHGLHATFFVATAFTGGGMMWNDCIIETIRAAPQGALDAGCLGLGMLRLSDARSRRAAIDSALARLKYLPQEERQRRVDALRARTRVALPAGLMMTVDQLRRLREGGMDIGAHTVSHPILATLDPERAASEIADSKRRLEAITGAPVTLFAYPNGKPGVDYRPEHAEMVRALGFEAAVSTAWGVATAQSDPFELPRFTPWDKSAGKFLLRLLHNTFRAPAEQV